MSDTGLLSCAQVAKRYRRRREWVAANLPSIPDPDDDRRRVYSLTSVEAYFTRLGQIEAEKKVAS